MDAYMNFMKYCGYGGALLYMLLITYYALTMLIEKRKFVKRVCEVQDSLQNVKQILINIANNYDEDNEEPPCQWAIPKNSEFWKRKDEE